MSNDAKLERCQAATAAQKIPTRGEMSGIRLVHRAPELGRQRGNLARNLEALWRFCFPTAVRVGHGVGGGGEPGSAG